MSKFCPQCRAEYVFKWNDLVKRKYQCSSCGAVLKINYNKLFLVIYLGSSFIVPFLLFKLVFTHSVLSVTVNTLCILGVGYLGGMYFGRLSE
ncbi:hypothetical protein ACJVC5_19125 [Peredibacter sp. HCB2-198]|uniref:hypothetical protein n=1 Tax=Peredibacter sp. HCB2-198 TaxID=3383025 RepID=UPI0038B51E52